MNSLKWHERAERWQERLDRLRPALRAAGSHQASRIHNKLFEGVEHALVMAAICGRCERGEL